MDGYGWLWKYYINDMRYLKVHIQQRCGAHGQFREALAMPHPSQLLPIGSELWVGASTPSNVSRVVAVGTFQGDMNEWAWEMGSQCSPVP